MPDVTTPPARTHDAAFHDEAAHLHLTHAVTGAGLDALADAASRWGDPAAGVRVGPVVLWPVGCLASRSRHDAAMTAFVYRSPYEGPFSKHVRRVSDASTLEWLRRGWQEARDDPLSKQHWRSRQAPDPGRTNPARLTALAPAQFDARFDVQLPTTGRPRPRPDPRDRQGGSRPSAGS